MAQRLISVLTPVRNGEEFIARAFDSVTVQPGPLEPVIDGASTDRTAAEARRCARAAKSGRTVTPDPVRGNTSAVGCPHDRGNPNGKDHVRILEHT